jgi:gluconate 2-dehydrogenase gamma chain
MTAPQDPPPRDGVDRRLLLGGAVAAAATGAFFWLRGSGVLRGRVEPTPPGGARRSLTALEWRTLDAAQQTLLPSAEGSPGAADVNAIGYLDALLQDPAIEEESVERTLAGAGRLHAFALERGAADYAALDAAARDEGLRLFLEPWEAQLFLRGLLAYTLEAFLCDPVHGGNPDEIAWTWADHQPGHPRPTPGWRPRGRGPTNSLER